MKAPNVFDRLAEKNKENDFSSLSVSEPSQGEDFEGENIFDKFAKKQNEKDNNQFGFLATLKDIGQQIFAKGAAGVAGAYGNILDSFGLQGKEGEVSPAQEARSSREFDTLEKMNRGERPSFSDLMDLSGDEIPSYNRLPTSKEVGKGIENVTGVGEGKTPLGRIAGRGAEFAGEGVTTGGSTKALLSLGLSGTAGQTIRENDGPEWAASGTEIAGSVLPSLVSGKLNPTGKGAKDIVNAGRKVGLTESQITPLIQGETKAATLSKVARKGNKTKKLFGEIKEKLGDSYNSIKSRPDAKVKIPNSDQVALNKDFAQIRNNLSKTLAGSPDREAALSFIEKSMETLRNNSNITPEYLVNFWQDINKSVKWNSIAGGKKALTQLKKPVGDILEKVSPQLAQDFEMTNQLYSKYAQISKKLKPDFIDALVSKGELITAPAAGLALAQGNPWPLAALGAESATRILAREMLINPYFQNVSKKLVTQFNAGSMKAVTESVKQVQEYMTRKYPDEKWAFLTENVKDED